LIVVAVPVGEGPKVLAQIAKDVSRGCLVIDVGSVKTGIVRAGDRYFSMGQFVACPPMAGSEKSGTQSGTQGLFSGKKCFVVPGKKSGRQALARVFRLWRALGAVPVSLPARKHDRVMAAVSHLPQLLSSALVASLAGQKKRSAVKKYAGSGWRDMTRLAASDENVWVPIFTENKKNLLPLLARLKDLLQEAEAALKSGDLYKLKKMMLVARRFLLS
jgi:prephenate dehydrogenase